MKTSPASRQFSSSRWQTIAGEVGDARPFQMSSRPDRPRREHEGSFVRRVDRDDLEAAVVEAGHRGDVHAGAEVATVADGEHEARKATLFLAAFQRKAGSHAAAFDGSERLQ